MKKSNISIRRTFKCAQTLNAEENYDSDTSKFNLSKVIAIPKFQKLFVFGRCVLSYE